MVSVESLLDVIPAAGVIIALVYYTLTIRNQNKTRKAQLLWSVYEVYRSPQFRERMHEIINQEWTDFDEFWEKYGSQTNPKTWARWQSIASTFHGIGVLLKKGLIDIDLVDELIVNQVLVAWFRMGPIVEGFQEWVSTRPAPRSSKYETYSGFKYLYEELIARDPALLVNDP